MRRKQRMHGRHLQNKTPKPPKGGLLVHSPDLFDEAENVELRLAADMVVMQIGFVIQHRPSPNGEACLTGRAGIRG